MKVLSCSVTAAGAALARRLPYEHHPGHLGDTVRSRWPEVDGLVLFAATGAAVRVVAPLLEGKAVDPAVVCVDDGGRWAVALTGGHAGGANRLAREVAALLGAEPVVTTASDGAGLPALDALPGWEAEGDLAGVMRAWVEGQPPAVRVEPPLAAWPLPAGLPEPGGNAPTSVTVTDSRRSPRRHEVFLRPRSLVLGVGASSGADSGRLADLAAVALEAAGLHRSSVGLVATLDRKAREPAVVALAEGLGARLVTLPAAVLSTVPVPNPSPEVAAAVGTPSVSEAAALVAAGPGGRLVSEKKRSPDSTVAVARRPRPSGHLAVVGVGPGGPAWRTAAATATVAHADAVVGYGPYVDLVEDLLQASQHVLRFPIGAEAERAQVALERAAVGERVALVCSGDPGVFAMATLVLELAPRQPAVEVTVVPGVTAALAAAAVLGAPLAHDHAAVSLSDLLTPWEVIERRLRAVADADMAVSLYNPRSRGRSGHLARALALLAEGRDPSIPAAVVTGAGRAGMEVVRGTIGDLDPHRVGMSSIVVVGASSTRWSGDRMVTPRGYAP